LERIIEAANETYEEEGEFEVEEETMCHNVSKIRTTVKQFFREWCAQSPELHDYHYLVDAAKKYLKKEERVLVPGCGLARLALELVEAGFHTQGNEVTYFMLYGSNFVLNCAERKEQFEIYPFIHSLINHESEEDMFRGVKVPDKLALEVVPQDADFSMASGEFTEIYRDSLDSFAGVVTCFFLDTANNIFAYIDTIEGILRPGGIWINYGPLLYHFKDMLDQISVELSWEQVVTYIELKGFKLIEEKRRSTTYCHDPLSSYTNIYQVSMTVWQKPGH
jgi:carnosine N-methyltransferase